MRITSGYETVGRMPRFAEDVIREERSLGWSTVEHAREHGGPVTRAFIAALPEDWQGEDVGIQVKMSWLKRGWLSGPLGFHCDWLDVDAAERGAEGNEWPQAICAVVGAIARTRFVVGDLDLPPVHGQREQMRAWRPAIQDHLDRGLVAEHLVAESTLFRFGPMSLHARSPAERDGWRIILRSLRRPGRAGATWNRPMDTFQNGVCPMNASEAERFAVHRGDGAGWSFFAHLASEGRQDR